MRLVVLYRGREFEENELAAAQAAGFYCTDSRMDVKAYDLVIGRYSVLPFFREQERDLARVGARLLNNYTQHSYLADLGQWYQDFRGLTPKTWEATWEIPDDEDGPFFLKGATNSKKFLFDTHCLAKNKKDISNVLPRLLDDTLIGEQKIYIRKFEHLLTYGYGLHGLPITREYRFFWACQEWLTGGYYWASHVEDLETFGVDKKHILDAGSVPKAYLDKVGRALSDRVNGAVVDIAQKADGGWTVVELNDLMMSGLSCCDPYVLYKNLHDVLARNMTPDLGVTPL